MARESSQRNYDTLYGYILGNSSGDTGKAAYMIQRLNDLYEVTRIALDALSVSQKVMSKTEMADVAASVAGVGEGCKEHPSDENGKETKRE